MRALSQSSVGAGCWAPWRRGGRVGVRALRGAACTPSRATGPGAVMPALAAPRPELLPLGALVTGTGSTAPVSARRPRLAALGAAASCASSSRPPLAAGGARTRAARHAPARARRGTLPPDQQVAAGSVQQQAGGFQQPVLPLTPTPRRHAAPGRTRRHFTDHRHNGSAGTFMARRSLLQHILADGVTDPRDRCEGRRRTLRPTFSRRAGWSAAPHSLRSAGGSLGRLPYRSRAGKTTLAGMAPQRAWRH